MFQYRDTKQCLSGRSSKNGGLRLLRRPTARGLQRHRRPWCPQPSRITTSPGLFAVAAATGHSSTRPGATFDTNQLCAPPLRDATPRSLCAPPGSPQSPVTCNANAHTLLVNMKVNALNPFGRDLSAHEMAWCRLIVDLPLHLGGLGITPLPASGMTPPRPSDLAQKNPLYAAYRTRQIERQAILAAAMEANPQKGLSTPCRHTSGSPHHRSKGEERLQSFWPVGWKIWPEDRASRSPEAKMAHPARLLRSSF